MDDHLLFSVRQHIAFITLNRPQALNSLSLPMVRALTERLLAWRDDPAIRAVCIGSNSEKAFCAGGDIRFFYQIGRAGPQQGSALLEDFFTEEYALNQLIHRFPKPYIALLDGIVMGGGMGISQCRASDRLRVVTERTKMAMPEVNIGLFPDVGASFFLSRCPGHIGRYLGLSGLAIGAADALYAGLADIFLPSAQLPALQALLTSAATPSPADVIREFAAPFQALAAPEQSLLAKQRECIDRHFAQPDVTTIMTSLSQDATPFAAATLSAMQKRSPLMLCVTLEQLRRGGGMSIEACLRMERSMMRHCFEGNEVMEGIRATVIDKDQSPHWQPAALDGVTPEMAARFFVPAWPDYLHPLRTWL